MELKGSFSCSQQPLYSRYPLDRRLGGPQNQTWTLWSSEKLIALARNRTLTVIPVARSYTGWAIAALKWIVGCLIIKLWDRQEYPARKWVILRNFGLDAVVSRSVSFYYGCPYDVSRIKKRLSCFISRISQVGAGLKKLRNFPFLFSYTRLKYT
jgi:hypothetical protein